ncbi:hypothetical protein DFH06DRAFT_1233379 [Mycena polygramma]|nr:hypothetical protein DFH06DRAFT_1233379 [Mycena polygramma]
MHKNADGLYRCIRCSIATETTHFFPQPQLPIQPTMLCRGCNTPWYHHAGPGMPAMPSTSGFILPQASYPPSDTFLPPTLPRTSTPQIQGKSTAVLKRITATSRCKRVQGTGPPLLLTLADDAIQLQNMDRFLRYLLELEPLIDGYENIANPTPLQSRVHSRRDFLLPFREHGPSRVKSQGPAVVFDHAHSGTWAGLFSGLIFCGMTFASPFALQASKTVFANLSDWEAECAKFPNPSQNFFCNPWAYSKRKSPRGVQLVAE